MEFDVLKKSHVKRNIIIGVVAVFFISAIILNFTSAKYRVSDSVPIINSKINYKVPDLNMVSVYIANEEGIYEEADIIPTSGYTLNTKESYCGISNNGEIVKDDTVSIVYENGQVNVLGITKKGTKCYLYFDEQPPAVNTILAGKDIQTRTDFSTPITRATTGVIYQTTDWKGTSYYFAGAPTDNWVNFGGFYWRIVRTNGDGSVRLIYNGTTTLTTGKGTLINNGTYEVFNSSRVRSEYVGLKYTIGSQHGQTTDSSILNILQSWYTSSNLDDYAEHIDINIGFCNDREMANGYTWSSQPSSTIYYATYERIYTNQNPNLACTSSDIIKEPVGLITADEVMFGGVSSSENAMGNYLINEETYWTMSPSHFYSVTSHVRTLLVGFEGYFSHMNVDSAYGVRPVINLKADTKFTGSGTSTDPYIVS